MAKGYWIANVDVRNADGYKKYVATLPDILRKFGGRYVTRGGKLWRERTAAASSCLSSPVMSRQWPAIARRNMPRRSRLRQANADADLIVIEGYDGPQP
jgi:uncharacterized protein (DUF1330 family)